MGIDNDRRLLLRRRSRADADELLAMEHELREAEYVLHLRHPTRAGSDHTNVYPFEITTGLYLMHTGALRLKTRAPGKSDTWHLVHNLLRPLAVQWHDLFVESGLPALQSLLEHGLGPDNKLVLLDYPRHRLIIVHRGRGIEVEGLWLSDAEGLDSRLLACPIATRRYEFHATDIGYLCF